MSQARVHFLELDSMLLTRHAVSYRLDGSTFRVRANGLVLCRKKIQIVQKLKLPLFQLSNEYKVCDGYMEMCFSTGNIHSD